MEEDPEYTLRQHSLLKGLTPEDQIKFIKDENEKLRLENAALKKNLKNQETLHRMLYNQWKELNENVTAKVNEQLKSQRNPRNNIYRYISYALLLVVIFLIIIYLNSSSTRNDTISAGVKVPLNAQKNSAARVEALVPESKITTSELNNKIADKEDTINSNATTTNLNTADSKQVNKDPISAKVESNNATETKYPARYIIKVKSYFYDKPDTSTRLNTFVLPLEDEYGILTALDDKNGFIYAVFKNPNGRASKGWILKGDLYPLQ